MNFETEIDEWAESDYEWLKTPFESVESECECSKTQHE